MKEPKIRFKGFQGEWDFEIIGNICKITTGKSNTQDQVQDGKFPFFIRSEKIARSAKYLYNEEAIITIGDGNIGKVFHYIKGKFDLHQRCYMMYAFDNIIHAKYFYYYFATHFYDRAIKMSAKATVDSVRMDMIADMKIDYPSTAEQQSIATYFQHLDSFIQSTTKKIESLKQVKAASLQSMFPQEGETTPRVRFKGFEGEWEINSLSTFLTPSNLKNRDYKFTKEDVLSVSGEFGIVNQIAFQGRSFAGVSVANYGVVEHKDIVYTKSPLKTNPYGIIKTNEGDAGIVSTLYAVYKCANETNPTFVQYYFDLDSRINSYLRPLVRKGAKNDMKVSSKDALLGNVIFPTYEEQQKIASYFTTLDRQITLQTQRLEKLKQIKSACLDEMFV